MSKLSKINSEVKVAHIFEFEDCIENNNRFQYVIKSEKFGIVLNIDGLYINIKNQEIYEVIKLTSDGELADYEYDLNRDYIVGVYELGENIEIENGFIRIDDDPSVLEELVSKTKTWYQQTKPLEEAKKLIYFDKRRNSSKK